MTNNWKNVTNSVSTFQDYFKKALNVKTEDLTSFTFLDINHQSLPLSTSDIINTNDNSIKFKRMYWSSRIEIIARILLLLVSCLHLIFSYFLANNLVNQILANNASTIKPNYIIYIFLVITLGFNFVFYLPLAIGRTANAIFGWSVVYIVLAIGYFVVLEIFCTILLVVDGLVNETGAVEVPIFMVIVLLITILWLVAAWLLIVKSDDVRRELSVE